MGIPARLQTYHDGSPSFYNNEAPKLSRGDEIIVPAVIGRRPTIPLTNTDCISSLLISTLKP